MLVIYCLCSLAPSFKKLSGMAWKVSEKLMSMLGMYWAKRTITKTSSPKMSLVYKLQISLKHATNATS